MERINKTKKSSQDIKVSILNWHNSNDILKELCSLKKITSTNFAFDFIKILSSKKRDFYEDGIGDNGWQSILRNKVTLSHKFFSPKSYNKSIAGQDSVETDNLANEINDYIVTIKSILQNANLHTTVDFLSKKSIEKDVKIEEEVLQLSYITILSSTNCIFNNIKQARENEPLQLHSLDSNRSFYEDKRQKALNSITFEKAIEIAEVNNKKLVSFVGKEDVFLFTKIAGIEGKEGINNCEFINLIDFLEDVSQKLEGNNIASKVNSDRPVNSTLFSKVIECITQDCVVFCAPEQRKQVVIAMQKLIQFTEKHLFDALPKVVIRSVKGKQEVNEKDLKIDKSVIKQIISNLDYSMFSFTVYLGDRNCMIFSQSGISSALSLYSHKEQYTKWLSQDNGFLSLPLVESDFCSSFLQNIIYTEKEDWQRDKNIWRNIVENKISNILLAEECKSYPQNLDKKGRKWNLKLLFCKFLNEIKKTAINSYTDECNLEISDNTEELNMSKYLLKMDIKPIKINEDYFYSIKKCKEEIFAHASKNNRHHILYNIFNDVNFKYNTSQIILDACINQLCNLSEVALQYKDKSNNLFKEKKDSKNENKVIGDKEEYKKEDNSLLIPEVVFSFAMLKESNASKVIEEIQNNFPQCSIIKTIANFNIVNKYENLESIKGYIWEIELLFNDIQKLLSKDKHYYIEAMNIIITNISNIGVLLDAKWYI